MSIAGVVMQRCLTRRRAYRLRVVVCTRAATKRPHASRKHSANRQDEPAGNFGTAVLPQASNASTSSIRRQRAQRPCGAKGMICLGAAQLAAEADKPPNAAPAGRAGSFRARRTASRRLQMLNVNCLCIAASGAPPVRSRVYAACSLTSGPLGRPQIHLATRFPRSCHACGAIGLGREGTVADLRSTARVAAPSPDLMPVESCPAAGPEFATTGGEL